MAKQERATDKLNVAIATISAAATVAKNYLDQPGDGQKRALKAAFEQIGEGVSAAYEQLRAIRKAIETI